MKRTSWTLAKFEDFRRWHEATISIYPEKVQVELRRAREKFLGGVPLKPIPE